MEKEKKSMTIGMRIVKGFLSSLGFVIWGCILIGVPMAVMYFFFGGNPIPDTSNKWSWYTKIGAVCLVVGVASLYMAFMLFVLFEFMVRWKKRMKRIETYLDGTKESKKDKKKKNKEKAVNDSNNISE
jgi:phosphate/sulfate permease